MSLRNLICLHSTYFLSSTTTSAVTRKSAMHELNCMIVFENMDRFQSNEKSVLNSKIAKFGREMLKNVENIALQNLPIFYTFVLRAEIRTTFGVRVVQISACNRNVYKNDKFCKAIFSEFFNISQPNFALLLFLI